MSSLLKRNVILPTFEDEEEEPREKSTQTLTVASVRWEPNTIKDGSEVRREILRRKI